MITPKDTLRQTVEKLVDEVADGKVYRRTLPNRSVDYPLQQASESFDNFLQSDELEAAVERTYRRTGQE